MGTGESVRTCLNLFELKSSIASWKCVCSLTSTVRTWNFKWSVWYFQSIDQAAVNRSRVSEYLHGPFKIARNLLLLINVSTMGNYAGLCSNYFGLRLKMFRKACAWLPSALHLFAVGNFKRCQDEPSTPFCIYDFHRIIVRSDPFPRSPSNETTNNDDSEPCGDSRYSQTHGDANIFPRIGRYRAWLGQFDGRSTSPAYQSYLSDCANNASDTKCWI